MCTHRTHAQMHILPRYREEKTTKMRPNFNFNLKKKKKKTINSLWAVGTNKQQI